MKDYELSVLFHPDLEMNSDPALDKVRKAISQAGGNITSEENEGKKRLSYPIKGHNFAVYYYADVQLPSDAPDKLSTVMNINDEIIRYLLVRTDPRKAKFAKRRAEAEARGHVAEQTSEEDSPESDPETQSNAKEDN